jgi:hypothetical protein
VLLPLKEHAPKGARLNLILDESPFFKLPTRESIPVWARFRAGLIKEFRMSNVSNIRTFQHRLEQSRSAKAGIKSADQAHWDQVIAHVDEPEIARMIVRYFEHAAPAMKVQQPGLYLRARMVLANDYQAREIAVKEVRRLRFRTLWHGLGDVAYFIYRCLRLPVRAWRDLVALVSQRRRQNRPLFHH